MKLPIAGLCALTFAAGTVLTGLMPAAAAAVPGTSCSLFPADNILNTDISGLPVDAMSATWKGNMAQNANLHPDLGTFAQQYGMPINVAPPPTTGVTPTFAYDTESDHPAGGFPIDQNTLIEGGPGAPSGSDRHALVVNSSSCKLFELYNLQNFTNGQTPAAGSGAVWDLSSNAMRPAGWTSADAAGLPIMPLLLRPDEILAGSVPHAIRVTAHCAHGYVWPASHDAGTCVAGFPPMGARFRLRSGYDITRFSANTQVVLRAFERFGLIVADNGADWYFQGTTDDWWGTVAGGQLVSELKTIPAAQFDAVDESGVQVSPSSYMATAAGPASSLARAPAVAAGAMNQLEVAAVGQDRQVWHRSWNGTSWSAWDGEGGVATSDPGTASWSSTRFDVFVRGADNALWHKALDTGAWSAWERLGGTLAGGPGAATWGAGRLDVFVVGTDRGLWHKTWNGAAWTAWESLGGILTSDPSAASTGANRLDVFARGGDNQLWRKSWDGSSWGAWLPVGGVLSSAANVASQGANLLDVFTRGTDGHLWHRAWNGTQWAVWESLGGVLTSSPAASSWGANRLDVFARGTDLQLWHRSWDGSTWSAWERLVGPPGG